MHGAAEFMGEWSEPRDYFTGLGAEPLPTPVQVLLFVRTTRAKLQQRALQNRSHHRFVLIFNGETRGQVHVDQLMLPLSPGEALLVMPFQFHHFTQLESGRLRWLFCTFECAQPAFLEPLRNQVVRVGDEARQARERLVEDWRRAERGELDPQGVQADLLRLLLALKEDPRVRGPRAVVGGDNLVRRINGLLLERHGRVEVADAALAVGLSESRLRDRFRRSAGVPLGAYLHNYRINRAMELLRNRPLALSEVAEQSGFNSPQAFSRAFRGATGQTPRAYRSGSLR